MKFNNKSILPLFAVVLMSACSPKGQVSLKGVDISTQTINSDTFVNLEAIIEIGSLKLPSTEFGIVDPKTQAPLGQFALQGLADGTSRLSISVNFDEATKLDGALGKTLPNNRELPSVLAVGSTNVVGIPVLQLSRIYVGGDLQGKYYVGAAISIPALDSVLTQVPIPLNIFFPFPFSSQVTGVAGLYTGTKSGENGIGVFVEKSAPPAPIQPQSRTLASTPRVSTGAEELQRLDTLSLFRLNHLLGRHATLKVK